MPLPLSRTEMTASSPSGATLSQIEPPFSVYFAELFSRLLKILRQPDRIAVQNHGCLGNRDLEPVAGGVQNRFGCFEGAIEDVREVDLGHAQLHAAARNA